MAAEQRVFRVSGMHCAGCVSKVEEAVGALDGVTQVAVSLEPGLARVGFDPARVKPMAITEVVSDLGYAAEEHLAIPVGAGLLYPMVKLVVSPELAALLMAVSSLTVTFNTLLLRGFVPPSKRGGAIWS